MKPGILYTDKGFRPFTEYRVIQRGKQAGMIEIHLRDTTVSRDKHWSWRTRKIVVHPETIYRIPEV